MFSEHLEIVDKIREVFTRRIDDERQVWSLEVNVLDLKTFEILLMDRQATIGIDEAERIADGDVAAVDTLLMELCRKVRTPTYDRREALIQTRQHLYGILDDAGLLSDLRREFFAVFDEKFHEEERSDDRSRLLEVALEVDWLKGQIAGRLADGQTLQETASDTIDQLSEPDDQQVTVKFSGEEVTIDIPESGEEPEGESQSSDSSDSSETSRSSRESLRT